MNINIESANRDITANTYISLYTIEMPDIIQYMFSKFWDVEHLMYKEIELIKVQYEY